MSTPRIAHLIAVSVALCGVACAGPPPDGPPAVSCAPDPLHACDVARGEQLLSCTQAAAHPRAGCMKIAQETYGACVSAAGVPERGRIEVCIGECVFLHVTCLDQDAYLRSIEYPCDAWRAECDAECVAMEEQ